MTESTIKFQIRTYDQSVVGDGVMQDSLLQGPIFRMHHLLKQKMPIVKKAFSSGWLLIPMWQIEQSIGDGLQLR